MILCKVPQGGFIISGNPVGSATPATRYVVHNNSATGNANDGYLVIDGASSNSMFNNAASNSALYDIELSGDSMRFGFLTPASSNNIVLAGRYRDLRVKDCGTNNHVFGVPLIANNTDPCF